MNWYLVQGTCYGHTVTCYKYADKPATALTMVQADGVGIDINNPGTIVNQVCVVDVPVRYRIRVECTTEQLRDALRDRGYRVTLR